MALYNCPKCRRRVRGIVPKGGGSAEVYVRHNITRHSNIECSNGRQVVGDDAEPLDARTRLPLSEVAQEQLSGVRATMDGGVCAYCPEPILKDERITPHGEGWAHVRCHFKEHE